MPDNTVYLGLIATLFPRAKIIHCRRDVRDVALSCWMTELSAKCDGRATPTRSPGESSEHERLMEHWRRVLPVPNLEVDYEELVADLETVRYTRTNRGLVRTGIGNPAVPGVSQAQPPRADVKRRAGPPLRHAPVHIVPGLASQLVIPPHCSEGYRRGPTHQARRRGRRPDVPREYREDRGIAPSRSSKCCLTSSLPCLSIRLRSSSGKRPSRHGRTMCMPERRCAIA